MEDLVTPAGMLTTYAGRRVLITGHTGFKGSWLALWLTRLGARVTGYSDAIPTEPSHFAGLELGIDDRRGDICDTAALDAVVAEARPEIIFHLAAQSLVRKAYADPVATYRTNVVGTLAVLEAARMYGVGALVIATTDKVYRNDESGRRYAEEDELGGADPYSASKSCVELMARSYRETFLRDDQLQVATVRAGNVIGGGDWAEDRIVPDLVRALFSGAPAVVRNPASTRPWQHVLDVAAGYLNIGAGLLEGRGGMAEAWNLGPASNASIRVRDLIDAVRARFPQLKVEVRPEEGDHPESSLLQLDSSKAMARLGWKPQWEVEMLDRAIAWYQAYYEQDRVISAEQLEAYQAVLVR